MIRFAGSPPAILHFGPRDLSVLMWVGDECACPNRRAFLGTLGLMVAPPFAHAQPAGKVYRVGILQPLPNTPAADYTAAVRQGLRDHGDVEGRNIVIELWIASRRRTTPRSWTTSALWPPLTRGPSARG